MRKKLKRTMVFATLFGILMSSKIVMAGTPWHYYDLGVTLPAYQGMGYTSLEKKADGNNYSWINPKNITGSGYAIDCVLVDRYNVSVGEYAVVDEGYQKATYDYAVTGEYYKFKVMNHSSVSASSYVSGYWDTDFTY